MSALAPYAIIPLYPLATFQFHLIHIEKGYYSVCTIYGQ